MLSPLGDFSVVNFPEVIFGLLSWQYSLTRVLKQEHVAL